jgi:biopolymer transport protein ExbB/TolQ
MSEPVTTPAAPEVASAAEPLSFDQKLEQKMFGPEPTEAAPEPAAEPSHEETSDEPVIEAEAEEQAPASAEVELDHNGQKVRVSQEEARNLAQMGYDYTKKTQKLADDYRRVQSMATALQAQANLQPQFIESLAEAKAYERALGQFKDVDWITESNNDPVSAFQKRAHYDALAQGYQSALQRAQKVRGELDQAKTHADQQQLAVEAQRLQERIPEWRDQAKYQKESQEILKHLGDRGISQDDLGQFSHLFSSAVVVEILRDAWKYKQAVANSKSKKVALQSLPQVPKPGVPAKPLSASQQTQEAVKQLHQAKDPERKKALFDAALQAKMKRLGI